MEPEKPVEIEVEVLEMNSTIDKDLFAKRFKTPWTEWRKYEGGEVNPFMSHFNETVKVSTDDGLCSYVPRSLLGLPESKHANDVDAAYSKYIKSSIKDASVVLSIATENSRVDDVAFGECDRLIYMGTSSNEVFEYQVVVNVDDSLSNQTEFINLDSLINKLDDNSLTIGPPSNEVYEYQVVLNVDDSLMNQSELIDLDSIMNDLNDDEFMGPSISEGYEYQVVVDVDALTNQIELNDLIVS